MRMTSDNEKGVWNYKCPQHLDYMVTVSTVLYPGACGGGQEATFGLAALYPSPGISAKSLFVPGSNRPEGLLQKLVLAPINWTV